MVVVEAKAVGTEGAMVAEATEAAMEVAAVAVTEAAEDCKESSDTMEPKNQKRLPSI